MPPWNQVWRALRGSIAHDNATVAAIPETGGSDRVAAFGVRQLLRAAYRRWRMLCARGMDWMQEAQRAREQAALRNKRRAKRRSLTLLLNLLNADQRKEFQTYGYLHVTGGNSGDRYRIRVDSIVNIDVLSQDGRIRHHLCARPTGDIPVYDVMAGQLLYLQDPSTENRFLALANSHVTLPVLSCRAVFPTDR